MQILVFFALYIALYVGALYCQSWRGYAVLAPAILIGGVGLAVLAYWLMFSLQYNGPKEGDATNLATAMLYFSGLGMLVVHALALLARRHAPGGVSAILFFGFFFAPVIGTGFIALIVAASGFGARAPAGSEVTGLPCAHEESDPLYFMREACR